MRDKDSRPQTEESNAVTTNPKDGTTLEGVRIRKLTPRECLRLMAFRDDEIDRAVTAASNSRLYAAAGNSIVVDCLYYIFKEMC